MSPEPASYDPEEFVDDSQPWPRLLALKDGELLAKGEIFEHQTAARPKQAKNGSEPEPKQVKHGNQVIADRLCRLPCEVIDFTAGQDCDEGEGESLMLGSARGRWCNPTGLLTRVLAVLGEIRGGGPVWDVESGGPVCVLVADCQRPQSRARLKPETMIVTFEEFSPYARLF